MIMSDQEQNILTALGRIEAGQDHIKTEQVAQREDIRKGNDAIHRVEKETTIGFGQVNAALATVTTRIDQQEVDITRAHKKINDGVGGSNLKRDGAMVGGAGGLALFFERMLSYFSSNGGTPSG